MQIAAADDGQLLGNKKAMVERLGNDTYGDYVVVAKNPVRHASKLLNSPHRQSPTLLGIHINPGHLDDIVGWKLQTMLFNGVVETLKTPDPDAVLGSADVGDPLATDCDQCSVASFPTA